MTQINSVTGRPSYKPDWELINKLILSGLNLSQTCNALSVSSKTLNSACASIHGQTFLSYSKKLKTRLGKTGGVFDFEDTAMLIRHYYSGKLAMLDSTKTDKLPSVKAWYPKCETPRTGRRLMSVLSAIDVDQIMAKLRDVELSAKGVKVTRGYEYPLMCFASPEAFQNNSTYQKVELALLYEYVATFKYEYWDPTKLGVSLVSKSFIEFNKQVQIMLTKKGDKSDKSDKSNG